EYANKFDSMPVSEITADKILMPEDLTIENIKSLSVLEPFGAGNPEPLFAMSGARVERIVPLSQGRHSRVDVLYGKVKAQVLIFSQSPDSLPFVVGDIIDLMVNVSINNYAGNENISIKAVDYRIRGLSQDKYFAAKDCYEKYLRGENLPLIFLEKINPARDELVKIYKYINSVGEVSIDRLYMKMLSPSMNYCKLRLCIDAFAELGLIKYISSVDKAKILPVKNRVNLDESAVLKELQEKLTKGGY
ncbi:MAG: single-stranded-DNA-specific exonuclease RecJ, partial [Ruminococcus sp.]|nr:single-stranded-DNA-specific exonuclease RecJ [Ruminococcus sp.]